MNMVGYAFQINTSNQLELVKYSQFSNGLNADLTKISKRVAIFGHNNIQMTDVDDAGYNNFNVVNGINNTGTGNNGSSSSVGTSGSGTNTVFIAGTNNSISYFFD